MIDVLPPSVYRLHLLLAPFNSAQLTCGSASQPHMLCIQTASRPVTPYQESAESLASPNVLRHLCAAGAWRHHKLQMCPWLRYRRLW